MARTVHTRDRFCATTAARAAVALAALGALVAVAGCARRPALAQPAAAAAAPAAARPEAMGPAAAVARARADSMQYPYTAADIRFMSTMIGHHAQAVRMAGLAPTHGASPAVRRLAERIANAQIDEIALMQAWLRDRRQPVPEADTAGTKAAAAGGDHAGHGGHDGHAAPMPGMLTAEQMRQLDAARGPEFDRLFLTLMIQHHRGAVAMVRTLFDAHGAGQDVTVFKFASDVNVDQTTEIDRMLQMLLELPDTPRS